MAARAGGFSGKTMFISGASRGIGLAIAKRVAADGANIALVAKTADPHPKLAGTIYSAAKEIEQAGGAALPIVGDVRDGDSEVSISSTQISRCAEKLDVVGYRRRASRRFADSAHAGPDQIKRGIAAPVAERRA